MAKLDEKIMRIEACVRELAQDREDFEKGKVPLQLDARIAKTWVRQFDQVIGVLTAMVDDWKEVAGLRPERNTSRTAANGIEQGNAREGTRSPPSNPGSTDDQ